MSIQSERAKKDKSKKTSCGKPMKIKDKYIEMKEQLKLYHKEIRDSILNNNIIIHEHFKTNFYKALESLVCQAEIIKDDNLKSSKIEIIYNWYFQKMKFFDDLNPIQKKTQKGQYEILPDINIFPKDETYQAKNYPLEYEVNFRTEILNAVPPKEK